MPIFFLKKDITIFTNILFLYIRYTLQIVIVMNEKINEIKIYF